MCIYSFSFLCLLVHPCGPEPPQPPQPPKPGLPSSWMVPAGAELWHDTLTPAEGCRSFLYSPGLWYPIKGSWPGILFWVLPWLNSTLGSSLQSPTVVQKMTFALPPLPFSFPRHQAPTQCSALNLSLASHNAATWLPFSRVSLLSVPQKPLSHGRGHVN